MCLRVLARSGPTLPSVHRGRQCAPLLGTLCRQRLVSRQVSSSSAHARLIYPPSPSTQHHDLASFLEYASRSELSEDSTVFVGTRYEYLVADTLARYGFFLKRVGGSSDLGTDLLGTWTLPSTTQTLRILVQCKAGAQKVGPQHVRELEGAFVGAPAGWRGPGVMAILVGQMPATKGVRDSLQRSKWPMGFFCCSPEAGLKQMLWNQRAQDEGLDGLSVTVRHGADGTTQLLLVQHGKPLPILSGTT